MSKITVLGSGGWGIALAVHCFGLGHDVNLWTPFNEEADMLNSKRENKKLLKGVIIPNKIKITTDIQQADNSDLVIIAVPSFAVRQSAARLKHINCRIVVNVAKGFEKGTMMLLSDVISSELSGRMIAVLSGPSHAEEVAAGVPTSVVVSSYDLHVAEEAQQILMGNALRIYTSTDTVGVQVGGALKNIIAVAAGIENGLHIGDNTRAALITRGLAEIARLGTAMGASQNTFMGLSGLGDLIVTSMSEFSRNNRFGNLVGIGVSIPEALKVVGTVEGYYATEIAYGLSKKYNVEMPITEQCYNILYNGCSPIKAIESLMNRPGKSE